MHSVVVLLGGNQGDIKTTFQQCISKLRTSGFSVEKQSYIYQSKSWGYESSHLYHNQLLILNTNLNPQETLQQILQIEKQLGRSRDNNVGYADRPIDIDIMFYDDIVIESENLCIPHPRLHLRRFCLVPIHELMPQFIHPVLNKSIIELLEICPDNSEVTSL